MSGEVVYSPGFRVTLPTRLEGDHTSELNLEEVVEEGSIDGYVPRSDVKEVEDHLIMSMSQ
ncbi:hypothetical protein [Halorubrum tebenquichense]|uniref:hypothetical protein n=1 Tax=Halorubrum tebenquichense TaxID=119434 RepID=UPI0012696B95|nr:hypothetical protein [Halorubrum tebenquichense]